MAELTIRPCDPERDMQRLMSLDVTYLSHGCLLVEEFQQGLALVEQSWGAPHSLTFPIDLATPKGKVSWVAEFNERLVGLISVEFQEWNRRLSIWDFYVDAAKRKQGIGRRLIQVAVDYGTTAGAKVAWAETSNCNLPGIEAYKRLGFHVCGFDASLYCGALAKGQFAVFLARELTPDTRLALRSES